MKITSGPSPDTSTLKRVGEKASCAQAGFGASRRNARNRASEVSPVRTERAHGRSNSVILALLKVCAQSRRKISSIDNSNRSDIRNASGSDGSYLPVSIALTL